MDEQYEAAARLRKELSTAVHDPSEPTWAYRMKDEEIESKVFPADKVPDGWVDSPAKCVKPEEPMEVSEDQDAEKPRKPGRPRKVRDGDSA